MLKVIYILLLANTSTPHMLAQYDSMESCEAAKKALATKEHGKWPSWCLGIPAEGRLKVLIPGVTE